MNKKFSLLMASALLMAGSLQLRADEVKLSTALSVGEEMNLAFNADLNLTLTWGNGETEAVESTGALLTLPVKDADLTITTTQGNLTTLYCQGNRLTAIDLTAAPEIRQLFAADNELTAINVSRNENLETLDLQDNGLTSLTAMKLAGIKEINVANNKLTGTNLRLVSTARPEIYIISGNQLTSTANANMLQKAQTVWIQGNQVKTLALTQSGNLRSLVASGNGLTSLTFAAAPLLHDVWAENNQLSTLDFSKGAPKLFSLAVDHNQLTTISWDSDCKRTCKHVYLNDNALFLNSMPNSKYGGVAVNVNYEPQKPYAVEQYYDLNETIDFSDLINRNGWKITTGATYKMVDLDGNELVKGVDFNETGKKFTFLQIRKAVTMTVSTADYTFKMAPFGVGTTEAIGEVTTDDSGFKLTPGRGSLTVDATESGRLTVYTTAGVKVVDRMIAKGTTTVALDAGLYVASGRKIVIQ